MSSLLSSLCMTLLVLRCAHDDNKPNTDLHIPNFLFLLVPILGKLSYLKVFRIGLLTSFLME